VKPRTVVLVGTDHTYQRPVNNDYPSESNQFRVTLHELCLRHKARAVAEEMNLAALLEHGVAESVAQQLCAELGLSHQFSDPSREERKMLGIKQEAEIRIEGWQKSWSQEQIEAAVIANSMSDRIRELEWLRRIQTLDIWPLVFICGANHFASFGALLRKSGITVFEAFQDWVPT
jgi:hypothetical protein